MTNTKASISTESETQVNDKRQEDLFMNSFQTHNQRRRKYQEIFNEEDLVYEPYNGSNFINYH